MLRHLLLAIFLFTTFTAKAHDQSTGSRGAVYAMTNALDGNAVVAFDRSKDGALTLVDEFPTEGLGGFAGDPVDALGSQNPLILSDDNRWLFAVNAGSNEISVFRVLDQGLDLAGRVDSGGDFPVSIVQDDDLVYVLNAGGDGAISGYHFDGYSGALTPIDDSIRGLNAGGTNPPLFVESPAQVAFDPRGEWLLITIKSLNQILLFGLDEDGRPSDAPIINNSVGSTPFSFDFDRKGHLLISEAFGRGNVGDAAAGAVSSYQILDNGRLRPISRSVENGQTATCWLITDRKGRIAFTTNNASSTVSAYRIKRNGRLKLIDGMAADVDANPVDLRLTPNGRFLYVLNAFTGTIAAFRVNSGKGALEPLGAVAGLPEDDGAAGLAVR